MLLLSFYSLSAHFQGLIEGVERETKRETEGDRGESRNNISKGYLAEKWAEKAMKKKQDQGSVSVLERLHPSQTHLDGVICQKMPWRGEIAAPFVLSRKPQLH